MKSLHSICIYKSILPHTVLAGAGRSSKVHDAVLPDNPDTAETQVVETAVAEAAIASIAEQEPLLEIPPSQPRPEVPEPPKAD